MSDYYSMYQVNPGAPSVPAPAPAAPSSDPTPHGHGSSSAYFALMALMGVTDSSNMLQSYSAQLLSKAVDYQNTASDVMMAQLNLDSTYVANPSLDPDKSHWNGDNAPTTDQETTFYGYDSTKFNSRVQQYGSVVDQQQSVLGQVQQAGQMNIQVASAIINSVQTDNRNATQA
jgi:hypothetical protein